MPDLLRNSLFVATGGALGTLLRQAINIWTFMPSFPVGTVIENITGAFLLGLLSGLLAVWSQAPQWLRTGIGVGFCGGYTTMSTFAADSFLLSIHHHPYLSAGYIAVSLIGGMLMAWMGLIVGRNLPVDQENSS